MASERKELLRVISGLVKKSKGLALRHKKKLLLLLALVMVGYFIRKKMTINHVLLIINAASKVIQYLPLPEAPGLREMADYEHPNFQPIRQVLEVIRLEELKAELARK